MSYRCEECGEIVPAGTPMQRLTEYREAKVPGYEERTLREISKEIPVCALCFQKHEVKVEDLAEKFKTG